MWLGAWVRGVPPHELCGGTGDQAVVTSCVVIDAGT